MVIKCYPIIILSDVTSIWELNQYLPCVLSLHWLSGRSFKQRTMGNMLRKAKACQNSAVKSQTVFLPSWFQTRIILDLPFWPSSQDPIDIALVQSPCTPVPCWLHPRRCLHEAASKGKRFPGGVWLYGQSLLLVWREVWWQHLGFQEISRSWLQAMATYLVTTESIAFCFKKGT